MNFRLQIAAVAVAAASAVAIPTPGTALPLSDSPLFLTGDVPPMVMLNISKDHQLSYKAYTDYNDLTGDGVPETTYTHSFNYYGYFDTHKCYSYDSGTNRFVPQGKTLDKYCSSQWSGNFLNWATMTRMDIVRKILYGGMRSTDTGSLTVLERAYLPADAHAFAKYYNGSDVAKLTPFATSATPATGVSSSNVALGEGDKTFDSTVSVELGDQVRVAFPNDPTKWMVGGVKSKNGTSFTLLVEAGGFNDSGSSTSWDVTNLSTTGITLCNLTPGDSSGDNRYSQSNTRSPRFRVAKGNFALWGANEKRQCGWAESDADLQAGFTGGFRSNGNRALRSGISASAENPLQYGHGLGSGRDTGEFIVRVEVCKSDALLGLETCKRYPSGNYKPTGLLQQYGDEGLIRFGLITGSFSKNISGGVLRQAVSNFGEGVNVTTDGTFKLAGTDPTSGIVRTLNKIRIYGYDYGNNNNYGSSEGCSYQRTGIVTSGASGDNVNEGDCSSWGNPMSEIYLESLRYLAANASTQATPAFLYGGSSKDATLGLTVSTWTPPLNDNNYCTPLSVLNFNASVSSYDGDQFSSASSLNTSPSATSLTDAVGVSEGISGHDWFVGRSGTGTTNNNELCSAKTVGAFGSILGLCPEAPSMEGSYLLAGLAHFARTTPIKPLPTGVSTTSYPNAHKVETYGVALSTNVPRIEVTVNNKRVTILPAYRLDKGSDGNGPFGGGTLVDFKIVEQTSTSGKFYVNWEDSEMGGDYDQDMWGVIEYRVKDDTITVTTDAVSASTERGQGFGYVISGTTKDGPHFHSGIYSFDYTDGKTVEVRNAAGTVLNAGTGYINTSGGCRDCVIDNPPTSVIYSVTGNIAGNLKDPLWYAAKYGGFKDANANNLPDRTSEWDEDKDGNPDTFVFANDPVKLVEGLAKAFDQISKRRSSAAAVATNSVQLNTTSAIFQARFDSSNWSGSLYASKLKANGTAGAQIWDASQELPAHADRKIFTRSGNSGAIFKWEGLVTELDAAQQDALNLSPAGAADALGASRVAYLRGDRRMERQQPSGVFRDRAHPLGDIVNSNPFFVQRQYFAYERLPGDEGSKYAAFSSGNASRTPMVYVGANDGMLHAFNAGTGAEAFAYVPQAVYPRLSALTAPNYSHKYYADGSPYVGEAYFGGAWHTVLVSGLGGGGRSVFALDVTSPTAFSKSDVLWEFTDPDLCYSYSRPVIGRLANGAWAAIFGNGYPRTGAADTTLNCTTTGAYLYVVDLRDGSLIKKIGTGATSTYDEAGNGLSSPTLVDANGDRIVDLVYAGDLRGNMWKYDLSATTTTSWDVANTAAPVYSAKDASNTAQPITAAPEVGRHPDGGVLVYFGTGQYVATGDPSNMNVQSFYAIWDKARPAVSNQVTGVRDTVLQRQAIQNETTAHGRDVRTLTNNSVDWTNKKGWYMDLVQPPDSTRQGERVVNSPLLRFERVIFNTLIPSTATCSFGGTSWLMETSATTGQRIERSMFDLNGDGEFTSGDHAGGAVVGGLRSRVGITQTPAIVTVPGTGGTGGSGSGLEYKLQSGSDTTGAQAGIETTDERSGGQSPRGSWRQIPAK